jgi:hypothetical protein
MAGAILLGVSDLAVCECGAAVADAGTGAAADRVACGACGSTVRQHSRTLDDNVLTLRSTLGLKLVRGATGKVAQTQTVGARQSGDGSWTEVAVVVDWENDRYLEHVEAEDGGSVIHHDEGPLSAHRGHGSDKPALRAQREAAKAARAAERAERKAARDEAWRLQQGGQSE